jgi:hypothetical protein
MQHSFTDTEIKYLRTLTGLQSGSTQTLISTLAKLICKKKLVIRMKEQEYYNDKIDY